MELPAPDALSPTLRVMDGAAPHDWERVYRENVVSVYRLVFSKVGNKADAEDLTSQVFIGALPHLHIHASSGEIHTYLIATARTVLADHWRHLLGHPVTEIDERFHRAPTVNDSAGPDPMPRIHRILALLPPNYRRILELRFLERQSVREAAAVIGTSVANARVLQHRALRRAAELGAEIDA